MIVVHQPTTTSRQPVLFLFLSQLTHLPPTFMRHRLYQLTHQQSPFQRHCLRQQTHQPSADQLLLLCQLNHQPHQFSLIAHQQLPPTDFYESLFWRVCRPLHFASFQSGMIFSHQVLLNVDCKWVMLTFSWLKCRHASCQITKYATNLTVKIVRFSADDLPGQIHDRKSGFLWICGFI